MSETKPTINALINDVQAALHAGMHMADVRVMGYALKERLAGGKA